MEEQIQNDEVKEEISKRSAILETQIIHINNLTNDLMKHKINIENANQVIEQLIKNEKDNDKKYKLYGTLKTNVELITKIFSSISELENIRYRYHKEIDDIMLNKFRILKDKLDNSATSLGSFMQKLNDVMTNNTSPTNIITQEQTALQSDINYKL